MRAWFTGGVHVKKIDLHIHTVPTISDRAFTFSLETFKRYVAEARLNAVAVTNHDVFDADQFKTIQQALSIVVFPGIEVNVDKGHVLIIASGSDLDEFDAKTQLITQKIRKIGDNVSVEDLKKIFGDLGKYLVIPHYDKAPPIAGTTLDQLRPYISAGEVDSPKKFVRGIRDDTKLTPVLFSDARMSLEMGKCPTRQTYIDCGTLTLSALKACLRDKAKVALSEADGNKLWRVFEDGQQLSTGLNVLIGARSSGKTHTLNQIEQTTRNVKYIRQFSLVQQNDAAYEREFSSNIERRRSVFSDDYLSGLKRVVDDVVNVDAVANNRAVERYLETLLRSAEEGIFLHKALREQLTELNALIWGALEEHNSNTRYKPIPRHSKRIEEFNGRGAAMLADVDAAVHGRLWSAVGDPPTEWAEREGAAP